MRAVFALGFWRALGGIKGAKAGRRREPWLRLPAVALVTSAVGAPDPAWRRLLPPVFLASNEILTLPTKE